MRKAGVLLWPGIFWILAFMVPLGAVLLRAAGDTGAVAETFASPYYRGVFGFTIRQATLSTLFSVLIGLPGAALVSRYRFPGRGLLKSLTTVPFVLPPILAVLGFILVFGNSGMINSLRRSLAGGEAASWKILYSLKAIILAHVFYNFPLTMRIVGDAWSGLPREPDRAARSLGAGPVRTFLTVDLPRLIPSVLTATLLTFIYCFMSFTIILILGGGPELSTLEVEVYRLVKYGLDFSGGSALALVETATLLLLMGAYVLVVNWSARWLAGDARISAAPEPHRLSGGNAAAAMAYLVPALLLILAPLGAVAAYSFLGRTTRAGGLSPTLAHWAGLLGRGRSGGFPAILPVLRSLGLGLAVSAVTTVTASLTAWFSVTSETRGGRLVDALVTLPMAVSSIILGLGYLIIANRIPGHPAVRITFLVMVHTILALPFAHRIIADRFRSTSPRIRQASRASGASPLRTFLTVELPLARRGMVTAAVFALAISAGEMNATLILAPGSFTTIPLAIYRLIGAYDFFGACALGTVLIIICTAAFFTLDRFAGDSI